MHLNRLIKRLTNFKISDFLIVFFCVIFPFQIAEARYQYVLPTEFDNFNSLYSLRDSLLSQITKNTADAEKLVLQNLKLHHLYNSLGKKDSSDIYFNAAREKAYSLENETMIAHVRFYEGLSHFTDGKYLECYKSLKAAGNHYEEIGDYAGLFAAYADLGKLFTRIDEYSAAHEYLRKAEELALSSGDEKLIITANYNIGIIFSSEQKYNTAFHFYQKGLLEAEKNRVTSEIIRGNHHLARLHLDERDIESGIMLLLKTVELCKEYGEDAQLSSVYTMLAFCYNQQNDALQAVEYNKKALELRQAYGDVNLIGSALTNLGSTYFLLGNYTMAEYYFFRGLEYAKTHKYDYYTQRSYLLLHKLYEKTNKLAESLKYLKKHVGFKDSIKNINRAEELVKSKSKEEIIEQRERLQTQISLKENRLALIAVLSIALVLVVIIVAVLVLYYRNKKLNTFLIKAKEEAENAAELKNQFLAQMSHEVRTPLNSIVSFSNIIREEVEHIESETIRESVLIVENEIHRILRTMELILDMAQIQSGNYLVKIVKLHLFKDVINKVASIYKNELNKKGLKLLVINNITNPYVWADRHSLEQIIRNIVDNAIKYSSDGKIEVVVNRKVNNQIVVQVIDTGIGMSDEYKARMFVPFSQEEEGYSRRFEGNGLGLALVKKFCDLNKISIDIQSKKNYGTKVTLLLDEVLL